MQTEPVSLEEIKSRLEPVIPCLELALKALMSTTTEEETRVLRSNARRVLHAGELSDDEKETLNRLKDAEDVGLLAAPLAWQAIDQIKREIGIR